MKKIRLAMMVGILVLPILGVGTVYAINKSFTKIDEINLKQSMQPKDAEKNVELIGIFAPGFESELADAKVEYVRKYGEGNFEVLVYKGYTLLVPPEKAGILAEEKAGIDAAVADQVSRNPVTSTQDLAIAKIREVFGVEGAIIYNATLGAYTDEKGFQYNFSKGELVSKQVGITNALHTKFEKAYPYLKSGVVRTEVVLTEQARATADQIVNELFTAELASNFKANVQQVVMGDARVGFVYGNKEIHVLVDQVSGDVINFNKEN